MGKMKAETNQIESASGDMEYATLLTLNISF